MGDKRSNLRAAWTAGRLAASNWWSGASPRTDALGETLARELDEMKGLAMKLGQIVSYMDVPLPPTVQQRLARLQTGDNAMDLSALVPDLERALGKPLGELFAEVEPRPIAAASIGQVHRARLLDGRPVAVKLQYPEIAKTFHHDLGSIWRLSSIASAFSAVDGRALVTELADRLAEECDYLREARAQTMFREAFQDDPAVVIPEVWWTHVAPSVLTTTWIEALSFEQASQQLSPELRARVAHTMVRFAYRGLLELAVIQADPHPGNTLFFPDGRVVFLDFGCVRELDLPFACALRELTRAVVANDTTAFRQAALELGVVGRPRRFDFGHYFRTMHHLYRPFLDARFRFTPAFIKETMALNGPTSPNARTLAMPRPYLWVARLQWGLWSVLTRLGAEVDLRDVLPPLLDAPPLPRRLGDRPHGAPPG